MLWHTRHATAGCQRTGRMWANHNTAAGEKGFTCGWVLLCCSKPVCIRVIGQHMLCPISLGCGKGKVQHVWALLRVGEGKGGKVGVWQGLLHYRDGGRQIEAGEGLLHTLLTCVWLRTSDKCEAALCVCASPFVKAELPSPCHFHLKALWAFTC